MEGRKEGWMDGTVSHLASGITGCWSSQAGCGCAPYAHAHGPLPSSIHIHPSSHSYYVVIRSHPPSSAMRAAYDSLSLTLSLTSPTLTRPYNPDPMSTLAVRLTLHLWPCRCLVLAACSTVCSRKLGTRPSARGDGWGGRRRHGGRTTLVSLCTPALTAAPHSRGGRSSWLWWSWLRCIVQQPLSA
ncbi:hypothetical protein BGZ61DRAFT_158188 [Ilyonectria robusta]|uniref:uncharacterized protein n=1 Tax=Ilyonectria robusta TaxID=1079257 RepID=UPI001E8EB183|nr:uncharacterized protein BGZ61DRAFT_158188 [Ilyonectria robusta]KAH8733367.1 hypothetical protein BGZ61DRAFT_158188 [Ilyonectria robusta]